MLIIDLPREYPASWDDGMDWSNPDPLNMRYWLAIDAAIRERIAVVSDWKMTSLLTRPVLSAYSAPSAAFCASLVTSLRNIAMHFGVQNDDWDSTHQSDPKSRSERERTDSTAIAGYPTAGTPVAEAASWMRFVRAYIDSMTTVCPMLFIVSASYSSAFQSYYETPAPSASDMLLRSVAALAAGSTGAPQYMDIAYTYEAAYGMWSDAQYHSYVNSKLTTVSSITLRNNNPLAACGLELWAVERSDIGVWDGFGVYSVGRNSTGAIIPAGAETTYAMPLPVRLTASCREIGSYPDYVSGKWGCRLFPCYNYAVPGGFRFQADA